MNPTGDFVSVVLFLLAAGVLGFAVGFAVGYQVGRGDRGGGGA